MPMDLPPRRPPPTDPDLHTRGLVYLSLMCLVGCAMWGGIVFTTVIAYRVAMSWPL